MTGTAVDSHLCFSSAFCPGCEKNEFFFPYIILAAVSKLNLEHRKI